MSAAFSAIARHLHQRLGRYLNKNAPAAAGAPGEASSSGHNAETEALASVLNGLGRRDTLEPLLMLEAFLSSGEHLTTEAFSEYLTEKGFDCSNEKAAEVLELFLAAGFAVKHHAEGGRTLYEHTRPGLHHDHIICSGCGRTSEFNRPDVDGLIEKIACDESYCHLDHKLVVYGLCADCRRRRRFGLPLAETAPGESVMVVGYNGPDDLRRRLSDLGFRKGARLKILGEQAGSVIVLLDGCRLALSGEMAAGVVVKASGREQCRAGGPPIPHHHHHHHRHKKH